MPMDQLLRHESQKIDHKTNTIKTFNLFNMLYFCKLYIVPHLLTLSQVGVGLGPDKLVITGVFVHTHTSYV